IVSAKSRTKYEKFTQRFNEVRAYGRKKILSELEEYFIFCYYCLAKACTGKQPYGFTLPFAPYIDKAIVEDRAYCIKDYETICGCVLMMPRVSHSCVMAIE